MAFESLVDVGNWTRFHNGSRFFDNIVVLVIELSENQNKISRNHFWSINSNLNFYRASNTRNLDISVMRNGNTLVLTGDKFGKQWLGVRQQTILIVKCLSIRESFRCLPQFMFSLTLNKISAKCSKQETWCKCSSTNFLWIVLFKDTN